MLFDMVCLGREVDVLPSELLAGKTAAIATVNLEAALCRRLPFLSCGSSLSSTRCGPC